MTITITRFNSRSRGGSDAYLGVQAYGGSSFNSRSRGGSDVDEDKGEWVIATFQFTLPRGERQHQLTGYRQVLDVSIHAPAGGATVGVEV